MKISVVIISKENRKSLNDTLETFSFFYRNRDIEIVVVEATEEKEFNFEGIKYIKIPLVEAGFSAQRNIGVKNASGDLIVFIDDDVIVTEKWFDNLLNTFSKEPDLVGVSGAVFPYNPSIVGFCEGVMGHPGGGFRLHNSANGKIIKLSQVSTCNTGFKKLVIEQVNYFDEKVKYGIEDTDISIRITKKFGKDKFGYNPEAVVFHKPRNRISKIIPWYIRRGRSDTILLLKHHSHIKYVISSSILLKLIFVLLIGLINFSLIFWFGIVWYLWQLIKHRFMFKYFFLYNFSFSKRITTFFIFPFIKFIADLFFDFGRIIQFVIGIIKSNIKNQNENSK